MPRRTRASLSDWYARPEGEDEDDAVSVLSNGTKEGDSPLKQCFSPTKRRCSNYFVGDEDSEVSPACSREGSPKKRVTMSPNFMTPGGYDVGSTLAAPPEALLNAAMLTTLRGICADYFENNVSPILKYVQQTQEQLIAQMKELSAKVERKADTKDVSTRAEIEQVAARVISSREDGHKVGLHVRIEEMANAMNQKANAANVPTNAQLGLKANVKEQGELEVRVKTAEKKVASLSQELRELKKMDSAGAADVADITKVKAVFAAAGLRVDRQLKEMRQQMQQLRSECLGKDVDARWPGRKLDSTSVASERSLSLKSDNDSVDRFSLGASATPSTALEPEERAELKRIQAIVAAAGSMFSRDLTEVKRQMREVRAEMHGLRGTNGSKKSIDVVSRSID